MNIRIIHAADQHIGMKFNSYPESVRRQLIEERFLALQGIVELANEKKAQILALAGDLFDSTTAKLADIRRVCALLASFAGEAVWIIPGNHDFYQADEDSLWYKFKKEKKEKVHVFDEYKAYGFDIEGRELVVYPCACRSKHSANSVIVWVKHEPKDPGNLHIGLAHGNVEGLGLDKEGNYFNMTREELASAGLDLWLLGHIHVPFPSQASVATNPGLFMAATHTPDGWDRKHPGYCWSIEIDESKKVKAERIETGNIRFCDWSRELNSSSDIESLKSEMNALNHERTLVKLELTGRLGRAEKEELTQEMVKWKEQLLCFEIIDLTKDLIDEAYINLNYPQHSLPHKLLSALYKEDPNGIALQLASQLIEKQKK